jgi:hypothetical protein
VSWKDEFCSCDDVKKSAWGTRPQYGLDVCGFCLKPFLVGDHVTDEIIAWRIAKDSKSAPGKMKPTKLSDKFYSAIGYLIITLIALVVLMLIVAFFHDLFTGQLPTGGGGGCNPEYSDCGDGSYDGFGRAR